MSSTPTSTTTAPATAPGAPLKPIHPRDPVDDDKSTAKRLRFEEEGTDADTQPEAPKEMDKTELEKLVAKLYNEEYGVASMKEECNAPAYNINNYTDYIDCIEEQHGVRDIEMEVHMYMGEMVKLLRLQHSLITLLQKENKS
jgi:hypothetical protein